jgi:arylsulfatase A-like enzyme
VKTFVAIVAWLLLIADCAAAGGAAPNIVVILTDDQDYASWSFMPTLQAEIIDQGLLFPNYFDSVALCCPSRTTILRGQYVHNHGVLTNRPPFGGYGTFVANGLEASTIAVWLQDAGYRTALFGKYLNGYPDRDDPTVPRTHVPAGWTGWYAPVAGNDYGNFNYTLNENGTLVRYGSDEASYLTDVLSRKAAEFIADNAGHPLFLYIATYAPHGAGSADGAPVPAPRHALLFPELTAPRTAAFNEADVGDKPAHVRERTSIGPMRAAEIDRRYRERIRSLQAIDELIAAVLAAIEGIDASDTTYVFFTSDNGFMLGQHRIRTGKSVPYEESIRVGLAVRGPGIPRGEQREQLCGNVDIAPTLSAIGAAAAPAFIDGRSLVPLFAAATVSPWRQRFLVEFWSQTEDEEEAGVPEFHGVRSATELYVEYATGDRELYDLIADADQLESRHATAPPGARCTLAAQVAGLKRCEGARCRELEERAPFVPGDCDADGEVTVDELVRAVRIALGGEVGACAAADADSDRRVSVAELVQAVTASLAAC